MLFISLKMSTTLVVADSFLQEQVHEFGLQVDDKFEYLWNAIDLMDNEVKAHEKIKTAIQITICDLKAAALIAYNNASDIYNNSIIYLEASQQLPLEFYSDELKAQWKVESILLNEKAVSGMVEVHTLLTESHDLEQKALAYIDKSNAHSEIIEQYAKLYTNEEKPKAKWKVIQAMKSMTTVLGKYTRSSRRC